jgi:hypothetical protein
MRPGGRTACAAAGCCMQMPLMRINAVHAHGYMCLQFAHDPSGLYRCNSLTMFPIWTQNCPKPRGALQWWFTHEPATWTSVLYSSCSPASQQPAAVHPYLHTRHALCASIRLITSPRTAVCC